MKKSIKKAIISLALCASAICVAGGFATMNANDVVFASADATVVYADPIDGFRIDDCASIRNTSPRGIRFRTALDDEDKTAIDALGLSDLSYGTLMIPADLLGSQELTHETSSVLDIPTVKWQDEGETCWTSALGGSSGADLSESYYNRPIAARSYVTGTKDGVTYYYYTENTAVKSIGYVAVMEKLQNNSEGKESSELIETIVSKTEIGLVFNEAGQISAIQNDEKDSTAIIENAASKSSDALAVFKIGGVELIGCTYALYPTITYTSDNKDVVYVDDTTVYAKGEGTATVTATCRFNGVDYSTSKTVNTEVFKGTSEYKILYNADSGNEYDEKAANLLSDILYEATGAKLPVVTTVNDGDKFISVGKTDKASGVTVTVTADTASQVTVDDKGNVYFLAANPDNKGIYYGVQKFLSEKVGYEYFMENTYSVNTNQELFVSDATFVRDITYNIQQEGDTDGYGAQTYSSGVIPMGINKDNQVAKHHQGVAHNSVLVVDDLSRLSSVSGSYPNAYTTDAYTKTQSGDYPAVEDLGIPTEAYWYATTKSEETTQTSSGMSIWKEYTTTVTFTYKAINNPYYDTTKNTSTLNKQDPFAVSSTDITYDSDNGGYKGTWTYYPYVMGELCYTAHGNTTAYNALVEEVAGQMYTELKGNEDLDHLGFSHMDHRIWCECGACSAATPSENLLNFLLDVAASVKTKLGTDDRAKTFKISSLFYHASSAAPTGESADTHDDDWASLSTKLTSDGKHIEIWYAETGGDYTVGMDDTTSNWNPTILANLKSFADLGKNYGVDILWWGYYGMVTQFFVPYDSIDALRINYGLGYQAGVDYMFNQMMNSKVNFTSLKEYLMSKLTWDAHTLDSEGKITFVSTDTYNGWINDYFVGAYGDGATKMLDYYNAWQKWTDAQNFNSQKACDLEYEYGTTDTDPDASVWHTAVMTTSIMPVNTLTTWLGYIDNAIAALNPEDPNYDTYYWNIKLEKLTPMFLLMYVHDGWNASDKNYPQNGTAFTSTKYVAQYGAEFLEICDHWGVTDFGEGRSMGKIETANTFKYAINSAISSTNTTIDYAQTVASSSTFTLSNSALTDGEYTAKVNGTKATVTVSNGVATISGVTLSTEESNTVVISSSSSSATVTFTNVRVETAEEFAYTKAEKSAYVVSGEQDAWFYDAIFVKGSSYTVNVDGLETTYRCFVNGKLNVTVGAMNVGAQKTVLVTNITDGGIVAFDVIGATALITTAKELKALGVGGKVVEATGFVVGNGAVAGQHVEGYYALGCDIDATGVDFAAGILYEDNTAYFKGTLDGNGYTVSNVKVSEGGIFGSVNGATIKNVNFKNVLFYGAGASEFTSIKNYQLGITTNADGVDVSNTTAGSGLNNNLQWGLYSSILGYTAESVTVSDVTIQVGEYYYYDKWNGRTSFLFLINDGTSTYTNVTIDAAGIDVSNVLGAYVDSGETYTNVKINVGSYKLIGSSDAMDGSGESVLPSAALETAPDGVTLITSSLKFTNTETVIEAGETLTLKTSGATDGKTVTYSTETDGVSISGDTLSVDTSVAIGTKITVTATDGTSTATYVLTVVNTEELTNSVVISLADNVMMIPNEVKGTVQSIVLDDVNLCNGAGDVQYVNGNGVYTLDETIGASLSAGEYKNVVISTASARYTATVKVATALITTLDDLQALARGGNKTITDTNAITGYYVLANDIDITHADDYSDLLAAGYDSPFNEAGTRVSAPFSATFDGNGYTIDNARISDGGLFGMMSSATVKNLNLTNVHVLDTVNSTVSAHEGSYIGLFAYKTFNGVTFENLNISIATVASGATWKRDSLFVCDNGETGADTYRNITVDASGYYIKTLFGIKYDSDNVYENVVIKAAYYGLVAYVADTVTTGVENITELPTGVTFVCAGTIAKTDQDNVSVYTGDVTALGFVEGTTVKQATITDGWSSRVYVPAINDDYDYVDIQFSLSQSLQLCVWDGIAGNYDVTATNTTVKSNAAERTIQIFDLDGNAVTSFEKGKAYVLRVYLLDTSGANLVTKLQISTFTTGTTLYFGDVTFGNAITDDRIAPTLNTGTGATGTVEACAYDPIGKFEDNTIVYKVVCDTTWYSRIAFPVDSTYDYVEFDIVLAVESTHLQFWTATTTSSTFGSFRLNTYGPQGISNCGDRSTWVFDANGNLITTGSLAANTRYTIRVGFSRDDTITYYHVSPSAENQTYYVSGVQYGTYTGMNVYDNTGSAYAYYDGDVTAFGFESGAKVTAVTIAQAWNNRVIVGGSLATDYVDVQISSSEANPAFLMWGYGTITNSGHLGWRWDFYTSNGSCNVGEGDSTTAPYRRVQLFDANGNECTGMAANTVYTLRIYHVEGEAYVHLGRATTLYFGEITYGKATELDATSVMSITDGTLTLPENVSGDVQLVRVGGTVVYSAAKGIGSISGNVVTIDESVLASLTLGENVLEIETDEAVYVATVKVATSLITTLDELKALGVGGNMTCIDNITGYYVLANDIYVTEHASDYSDLVAAGYGKPSNGDYSFTGIFDGNGYTIDNMRVSDGGIFGIMRGTVKDVNFTNVQYVTSPTDGVTNQDGGYTALIAYVAPGGTIENINVTVASAPSDWIWQRFGTLVNTGSWGATTFRNVTVDASGLKVYNLLGISVNSSNVYENVVFKAVDYTAIGYTGDSFLQANDNDGDGDVDWSDKEDNVALKITEFPDGVTFIAVSKPKTNTGGDLSVYEGDVTALGFAEGTTVYTSSVVQATNGTWADAWNCRNVFTMNDSYDYAEFDIVLGADCAYLQMWPALSTAGTVGQFQVYTDKVEVTSGSITPKVKIFDADGNQVTSGSFVANKRYTVRISINDAATSDQYHFAPTSVQSYFVSDATFIKA